MRSAPPDMRRVRRILIVKLSSIGDVVHALPVSAALGKAFPHIKLSWAVEERASPLVLGNPYLDRVHVLPREWRTSIFMPTRLGNVLPHLRRIRDTSIDLAIDLQGLSASALLCVFSGAPLRYGYNWLREVSPLLVRRVKRKPESLHIVDQLLDVARFLGASTGKPEFPIHVSEETGSEVKEMLIRNTIDGVPFISINPTEGGGSKSWGASRFAALIDQLAASPRMPIALIGGPEDIAIAHSIVAQTRQKVVNLVGQTGLRQIPALLRQTVVHIAGDTGTAHIAAALGTKVVSLFGRTNPARLAPYGQSVNAIHHRELCADPCRRFHERSPLNSSQTCKAPPPRCLAAITVDEVAERVRQCIRRQ